MLEVDVGRQRANHRIRNLADRRSERLVLRREIEVH
jgi:hypothetical protein